MRPNPYKDCVKCGQPVHARTPACKACGEVSPWAKAEPANDPEPAGEAMFDSLMTVAEVEKMLSDQPDLTPFRVVDTIDLEPSPEVVASYLHEITAPARAAEAAEELLRSGPHVFMDKFSTMIGQTLAHFKVNDVVTDFALLRELKAQGAPMVPIAAAPGMACCPDCKKVFKLPVIAPAKRAG
jgi:hypothetical protein